MFVILNKITSLLYLFTDLYTTRLSEVCSLELTELRYNRIHSYRGVLLQPHALRVCIKQECSTARQCANHIKPIITLSRRRSFAPLPIWLITKLRTLKGNFYPLIRILSALHKCKLIQKNDGYSYKHLQC